MIEFGKTLREAREAKGLSVSQLAEMTHMPPSRIEQLETEDFSKIPAPIYGRGFVRLYCEHVGLDPKPLSDLFTEIYNNGEPIEETPAAPEPPQPTVAIEPPQPPAAPAPQTFAAPEPQIAAAPETPQPSAFGSTDFRLEAETIAAPTPPPRTSPIPPSASATTSAPSAAPAPAPAPAPTAAKTSLSRYATPVAEEEPVNRPAFSRYADSMIHGRPSFRIPPAVWRLGLLASVALLTLWGLVAGIRALYRATSGEPIEERTQEETDIAPTTESTTKPTPAAKPAASKPAAPRTPQKIPSLYIN